MSAEGQVLASSSAEPAGTSVESPSVFEASRSMDRPQVEQALLALARCLGRQAARQRLSRGWSLLELAAALALGALLVAALGYAGLLHGGAQ